ncbi:chalcone synthase B [Penicillium odoratum]|uniref:chalcone synthase B n=1 Tax=Penicillium odoratum TaxID=1167516 RepID=UPI002548D647|nr:chalcone synthase B [Penicillium odoratum]KAJ5772590.1 chalcone synthase B [Penicillium odoratum]
MVRAIPFSKNFSLILKISRLQRLLKINEQTGIETRSVVDLWSDPRWRRTIPPKAEEVDTMWRQYGVQLAKKAALKALLDSETQASDITHLVAVTATNAGSPGYDQIVARELGIPAHAERLLISGVGCAGGLAALRVASNLARAATSQGRPARILVLACEICSIFICSELHAMSTSQDMGIAVALFGDGAAALVVCNSEGMTRVHNEKNLPGRFSIVDSRSVITPGTHNEMEDKVTSTGFRLVLSKNVPKLTSASLARPFESLIVENGMSDASPTDFDWAVHPGGLSIIKGAQAAMGLPDELVAASNEVYRTRGNTSSVAVLAALDKLRTMEMKKQHVVASSFGPGLTTEMMLLKRWQ